MNRLRTLHVWTIILIALAATLMTPVLAVFGSVFLDGGGVWEHLAETVLADYVKNSVMLAAGVGLLSCLIGVSCALTVTLFEFPGRKSMEWALLLPLAMPGYIIGYTYAGMLDATGPIQSALRETFDVRYGEYWFPSVRSLGGAIVVLSLVLYPYIYLLARAAFITQSGRLIEAAQSLGQSRTGAFRRVALPMARPAIAAGIALVVMETLADYGTVYYFGVSTFTTGIMRTWFGLGSSTGAAQLSALLLSFVIVLLFLERYSRRHIRYDSTRAGYVGTRPIRLPKGKAAAALVTLTVVVALGFLIPAAQLFVWALGAVDVLLEQSFWRLVGNTLYLAVLVALATLVIALLASYFKRNHQDAASHGLSIGLTLGYAVPGTVIAVGVLVPFSWLDTQLAEFASSTFGLETGLLLGGTLFMLGFAHVVRFLALAINAVDAGLTRIPSSLDEAARTMGWSNGAIGLKIHTPLLRGSLLTAMLLVFVDVMKELPATLVLRPFNFNTLAVRTFELANDERLAQAALPALMIVAAGIIPVILLSRSVASGRPVT